MSELVVSGFPPVGEVVVVRRQSGKEFPARLDCMPVSEFRDARNLHWFTDDNKFADVAFDPIVSWRRQDAQ